LDTAELMKFIHIANVVAICIPAIFAIGGVLAAVCKMIGLNLFKGKLFLPALCVASVAAFILEGTAFNYRHYLKYFAGPEVSTAQASPDNPNVILTTDGTFAEILVEQDPDGNTSSGVRFKNLNRNVTSIFAGIAYKNMEYASMSVRLTDEETTRNFTRLLFKYLPQRNHVVIQPLGKVSELTVMFSGDINISAVVLNKQIPFYFSGLRLLIVSFLIFALLSILHKKIRPKTAYYLFDYKFDPSNIKQNLVYAFSVVLLIFIAWASVHTSNTPKALVKVKRHDLQQYNVHLTDAIIAKKPYLDVSVDKRLLAADARPYDLAWLKANNIDFHFDYSFYNGKYYCYFGIVPAIMLYVPYKLITGNYLTDHTGIFLFGAISIILLAMLWRYCVKRYMPDMRFVFYLLSFLTLFFANGMFSVLSYTRFYSIVSTAGFMFAIAGILLLLKSAENEKINRLQLFFACLCLALVVGCRPNMIFVSLLVPVVLWRYLRPCDKNASTVQYSTVQYSTVQYNPYKLFLFIAIPYIIVAIPLMYYNYVRFGSITEFGVSYMLNEIDSSKQNLLNPIGQAIRTLVCIISYLFMPNSYSFVFPYVGTIPLPRGISGFHMFLTPISGAINFPIIFCLLYLFKNIRHKKDNPKTFSLLSTFLIVAITIIFFSVVMTGYMSIRYLQDFMLFLLLPSLFCSYYWICDPKSVLPQTIRMKTVYVLLTISILVSLPLFMTGGMDHRHPMMIQYLEYCIGGLFGNG
jgi:hypothetical protein